MAEEIVAEGEGDLEPFEEVDMIRRHVAQAPGASPRALVVGPAGRSLTP